MRSQPERTALADAEVAGSADPGDFTCGDIQPVKRIVVVSEHVKHSRAAMRSYTPGLGFTDSEIGAADLGERQSIEINTVKTSRAVCAG